MKRAWALVLPALAGCAVGPDYEPPRTGVPAAWSRGDAGDAGDLGRWWTTLGDPVLDSLIERALAAGPSLAEAEAVLREARALRRAAVADFLPDVDASASLTRTRASENMARPPSAGLRQDLYRAGFDASWEVDLWGGKRRALEGAEAQVEATEDALRGVRVALVAEVARNLIELRSAQRRLEVARQGLEGQAEILRLTRTRFDAGLATDGDVARAEAEVESVRAKIPPLEETADRARHRLAVLAGLPPAALDAELAETRPIPIPPAVAPAGLPADILWRRPDVRRAERELAAATADIGVARDRLYPHLSLLGSAGLESVGSDLFLNSSSRAWSVGPALTWRIFHLPQLWQESKAADARREQALARYVQAVLAALEDAENALAAAERERARREALAKAVAAWGRSVDSTRDLYARGLASLVEVIESERGLLNAQADLAASDAALASARVALFKALGGGWEVEGPAR